MAPLKTTQCVFLNLCFISSKSNSQWVIITAINYKCEPLPWFFPWPCSWSQHLRTSRAAPADARQTLGRRDPSTRRCRQCPDSPLNSFQTPVHLRHLHTNTVTVDSNHTDIEHCVSAFLQTWAQCMCAMHVLWTKAERLSCQNVRTSHRWSSIGLERRQHLVTNCLWRWCTSRWWRHVRRCLHARQTNTKFTIALYMFTRIEHF